MNNQKNSITYKFLLLIVINIGLTPNLYSQNICAFSDEISYLNNNSRNGSIHDYDNIIANKVIKNILNKINLKNEYFIVKSVKGIDNAFAFIYNGYKYIVIDTYWIERIQYASDDWFYLFTLTHEIAHHLLLHTASNNVSIEQSKINELEADAFAGMILAKYGAPINVIETFFINIKDPGKNSTHPPAKLRIAAIKNAYINESNKAENKLLQKIVGKDYFKADNFISIVNQSRDYFNTYIENENKYFLNKAIESYEHCIRIDDNLDLLDELSLLYASNYDTLKSQNLLEYMYVVKKDSTCLPRLLSYGDINNFNYYVKKYPEVKNFHKYKGSDFQFCTQLIHLFLRFHKYSKGDKTYFTQTKELINHGRYLSMTNEKVFDDYIAAADFFQGSGIYMLREENYYDAYMYFNLSLQFINKINKDQEYNYNKYFILYPNILVYNLNMLETSMKIFDLEMARKCIDNCENVLSKLIMHQQNTIPTTLLASFYFFKGLYLLNLEKTIDGCKCLKMSCDIGRDEACEKFHLLCE